MSNSDPFLFLRKTCNEAIAWVASRICDAGLQVIRTFDLQTALHDMADCHCPLHGSEICDCQMVVLLVYGRNYHPLSLIAHSYNSSTWFTLVDTPQQRADPRLQRALRKALSVESFSPFEQEIAP